MENVKKPLSTSWLKLEVCVVEDKQKHLEDLKENLGIFEWKCGIFERIFGKIWKNIWENLKENRENLKENRENLKENGKNLKENGKDLYQFRFLDKNFFLK